MPTDTIGKTCDTCAHCGIMRDAYGVTYTCGLEGGAIVGGYACEYWKAADALALITPELKKAIVAVIVRCACGKEHKILVDHDNIFKMTGNEVAGAIKFITTKHLCDGCNSLLDTITVDEWQEP